jgi:uncharacterized protein (TIGR02246 family)
MKLFRNAAIVLTLAGVAAGTTAITANANERDRPVAARDTGEVSNVVLAYGQALDADNLADVQKVYAPDAVVAPPGQPVKRGAAQITQFYADLFTAADVQITFTIENVTADRNLAYVTSHSDSVLKFKDGSPDAAAVGRELFVLRQTDGQWKIVAYWFNN